MKIHTTTFDLIYWQPPGTTWARFLEWLEDHAGHQLVTSRPTGEVMGYNRLLIHCMECVENADVERSARLLEAGSDAAPW